MPPVGQARRAPALQAGGEAPTAVKKMTTRVLHPDATRHSSRGGARDRPAWSGPSRRCFAHAIRPPHGRRSQPTFGRARACILLFMWGGPAQQETWDLKPDAPENVRGEFRPIATNVPGLMISEHFPALATRAHRLAVIRSVHHADVNHLTATHELLTGRPVAARRWRSAGRRLAAFRRMCSQASTAAMNGTVLPPFVQMRPTVPAGAPRFVESSHGQGAGWLGPSLNPLTLDDDPNREGFRPEASLGRIESSRRDSPRSVP